jgi:hypothetical protein
VKAGGGALGLTTDGGIPGFTITGCTAGRVAATGAEATGAEATGAGATVSAAGAGAAGAEATGAEPAGAEATVTWGTAAGGTGTGDAGVAAGVDGRRGRVGLAAAGFAAAAAGTGDAGALGSAGLPATEPVALLSGGVATPAETLANGAGPAAAVFDPAPAAVCDGKATLTSFGDGVAAASPGAGEPVALGSVGRRGGRRRRGGGGLCAFGGWAILGSTPLFRHIKEITDLRGDPTIYLGHSIGTVWQRCQS